ncbi:MAG: choice-of-anchor E domain-containing protein [Sphingomonadaceae bacterium]
MKKTFAGVVAAGIIGLSQAGNAATVSYSDSVAMDYTNWVETLSIPQFDASLGTLNSVKLLLTGYVEGLIRAENTAPNSSTSLEMRLTARIAATSDGVELVRTFPMVLHTEALAASDGTLDFGGTSGFTSEWLYGTDTDSATLTMDLASYIGAGTVDFVMSGLGISDHSGGGNVIVAFTQLAAADLEVTYDYSPIPLPASAPLLLGGIALLGRAAARRRSKA